jgi:translation initiation factor 2 subunit 2
MSSKEAIAEECVIQDDSFGADITRPKKKRIWKGPAVGSTLMDMMAKMDAANEASSSIGPNSLETTNNDDDLGFDPSKKKRKKPRKPMTIANEVESAIFQAVSDSALNHGLESYRAQEASSIFGGVAVSTFGSNVAPAANVTDDDDYSYTKLLTRIYDQIAIDKVSTGDAQDKRTIAPPESGKIGTKKTAWANFVSNCKSINRNADKVMFFVLAELGTTGSIDTAGKLIIKGRFTSKHFESILSKYIREYVACSTCRYLNTHIRRENRVWLKVCQDCGASSSVSAIQQGFRVQSKRKKM